MGNYQELLAWQKAMDLAEAVYCQTREFPKEEVYGLTSQIRRATISIPSNIAEGASRAGQKEFLQFLYIARGAASELETQLALAVRIGFLAETPKLFSKLTSVKQLINGLIRSLKGNLS